VKEAIMRKTIEMGLATILLALCLTKAAGAPVEGTWEGSLDGRKAVTLKVVESNGRLEGHVVFYVVDKRFGDREARVVGQVEHDITDLKWDGRMLCFSVQDPHVEFEMTTNGGSTALLKRRANDQTPELTVSMHRQ
jgi:hypothetical protein